MKTIEMPATAPDTPDLEDGAISLMPGFIRLRHQQEFVGGRWVEIASDLSAGLEVLAAIALELELAGFESYQIRIIELAFTEALINAIRHGNQDDPRKLVIIEYGIAMDQFRLVIEDEGQGFDPSLLDDPTSAENINRPGGRGLLLIQSLVETVEFNERGNRITMSLSRRARRAA